jgi:anti-sigma regulatory factor (Ser/Thr protein kinase)
MEADIPALTARPLLPVGLSDAGRAVRPVVAGRQVTGAVRLEPVLSSVGRARRLVGDVGRRAGLDPGAAEDAALVVSELVTNAVLHARTSLDVAVVVADAVVRVEVTDASVLPILPPEPHATPAPITDIFDEAPGSVLDAVIDGLSTTGRGMELVGALTRSWGVSPHLEGGKTVWAELGTGPVSPASDATLPPDPPLSGPGPGSRSAQLVAVPLRLIVESDHQFDDSLRELQVMAMADADAVAGSAGVMAAMAVRAGDIRAQLRPVRLSSHPAVRAARDRGDRLVDIDLEVPADVDGLLGRLSALLEDLGRARTGGHLLVLPPSREVVAYREWLRDEILRQLAGGHLTPCPFPVVVRTPAQAVRTGPLGERRLDMLGRLRADLDTAVDRPGVAAATVQRVAADMGAAFVSLLYLSADGTHVELADRVGYAPDETRGRRYRLAHDNPSSEAARTAWPIVLRTRQERLERYPHLDVAEPLEVNPTGVWIPLGAAAPAAGTLVVGFSRARDFTDADLQFLFEVGSAVALRLAQV